MVSPSENGNKELITLNVATFKNYQTNVKTDSIARCVSVELVRIESDYYFLAPSQASDFPKEREK